MTEDTWFPEDLRQRLAETIRAHRDTLTKDLVLLVRTSFPQAQVSGLRESLVLRVIELLVLSVAGETIAGSPLLSELADDERGGPRRPDVFAAVRLAERSILQELSLDSQVGAVSEHWPATTEIVRTAAFDVLAAVWTFRTSASAQPAYDRATGLMSRSVFEMAVTKELQRAVRYHHPLALILLEIDNLAAIAETQGRGVADRVLERLGVFMQQYFREPDWVARYSEDTIAVLLPETITRDAQALAEGARQAIEERLVFPDKDEHLVGVTVSAAVVTVTLRGESAGEREALDAVRVMTEAEAGVKRARARGGNTIERVEVARDSVSIGEAAACLHCSPGTIRKLITAGTLPAIESGGRTRIDRIALEAYGQRHPRAIRKQAR